MSFYPQNQDSSVTDTTKGSSNAVDLPNEPYIWDTSKPTVVEPDTSSAPVQHSIKLDEPGLLHSEQVDSLVDTIGTAVKLPQQAWNEEVNTPKNLLPPGDHLYPNQSGQKDWILGVTLLVFITLTWIRIRYPRYFGMFFKAAIIKKHFFDLMDEDNPNTQRISAILHAIFTISFALFIFQIFDYFRLENEFLSTGFSRFFSILVVVYFVYLLKATALKVVGFIFRLEKISFEYILNTYLINKLLGIILLPIIILYTYSPFNLKPFLIGLGIVMVSSSYLFRVSKGIRMYLHHQELSILYIILYLCALEILPLVVLVKLFMLNF